MDQMDTVVLVIPRSNVKISELRVVLEIEGVSVSGIEPIRFAGGDSHCFIRSIVNVVEDCVFDEGWGDRKIPDQFTVFAIDYRDRHLVSKITSILNKCMGEFLIDTNNEAIVSSVETLEPYLP
jgi:hypothetical protein